MTDPEAPSIETQPKADPETLALRATPGRVTRFRRGAIIAIATVGIVAVVGIAWFALKPAALSFGKVDEQPVELAARTSTEVLADAPATYGDVPQLGPPLPGDLGKPILDHRRATGGGLSDDAASDAAARTAQEAERQRIAAERKTARESAVMVQLAGAPRAAAPEPINDGPIAAPPANVATASASDPNGTQRKAALVGRVNHAADLNPHRLTAPVSPWTIQAGSVIAASLITGLNSDLPGLVTAQVTQHVRDSVTGRAVLIPQGSRLIGRYDSVVAFGQRRALVVWQRIILPDGSSIRIDNVPASDTQGYAGLADRIDRHTWQLLKGVALSTLLGAGTELSFGSSESDLVRAIRESAQQGGAQAGDQLVTRQLDVQPILTVRPGWPLRVVVHEDIVLPRPWPGARS